MARISTRLPNSVERALADALSLDGTDVPWTPEGRELPTVTDLRQSIDILTVPPADPKHMAWCLAKLQVAFESHLPKPSAESAKLRMAVWAETNADLGNDLWSEATMHCLQNARYGMPKPPDFRRAVVEKFTARQRRLDRCRRMMALHGDAFDAKRGAKPTAFQPEPEQDRLRASIMRFHACGAGSFLRPMLQRSAIAAEKRLAELEGRAPADWTRESLNSSPGEATKAPDLKLPPLSAKNQAALHRAVARKHREQGREGLAAMLEREADALAPEHVEEPLGDEHAEEAA